MISGKTPQHQFLAERAIDSILAQTYPNFEVVVINDSPDYSLQRDDSRVREVKVPRGKTLGELRNIGLEVAQGEWLWQADDDDYHHPDRLSVQMDAAKPNTAVMFEYQLRYSFPTNCATVHRDRVGIAGTIVHPKTHYRYPAKRKAEDSDFYLKAFGSNHILVTNKDMPELYVRFFHGEETNTWNELHIMRDLAGQKDIWQLPMASIKYLKEVLLKYRR